MELVWRPEAGAVVPSPNNVLISCFPSAGLAAIVTAHYMVRSLSLARIGYFDSDAGLSVALVQEGRVEPPIRVYGRPDMTIVLSEFPPLEATVRPLARAITETAQRFGSRWILAIEGVVPATFFEEGDETDSEPRTEPAGPAKPVTPDEQVWAVLARANNGLTAQLQQARARPLVDGVLGGVTGALLVRGLEGPVPVAALLVSARIEGYPDHRAAAVLIETIDRLLPGVKIDTGPLRTQAEMIERALRAAMKRRRVTEPVATPATPPEAQSLYQ